MNMDSASKTKSWRTIAITATVLCSALLSACGSDSDDDSSPATGKPPEFSALGGKKTLLVQVDGLALQSLHEALPQQPSLQSLSEVLPLLSGGFVGTASEQPTTALPSWGSLLTGVWAAQHGVAANQPIAGSTLQSPSVFTWVKQLNPEAKTALIVSTADYAEVLRSEVDSGEITQLHTCAKDDACVTEYSQKAVIAGTDLVVAQYSAPVMVSAKHGLGSPEYQQQLQQALTDISGLVESVRQREALATDEQWQIMLVSSYGVDEFGAASGSQFESNKTGWLLSNLALPDVAYASRGSMRDAQQTATIVDVLPTLLAGLGAEPSATPYLFNGNNLRNAVQLSRVVYDYDLSTYEVSLAWNVRSTAALTAPFDIYRDGLLLASVDASERQYVDSAIPSGATGTYLPLRYEIRTEGGVVAVETVVVPPPMIWDSVKDGLVSYYPFMHAKAQDAKGVSTMSARNTQNPGDAWITELAQLPYKIASDQAAVGHSALTLDMGVYADGDMAGYLMSMPNSDVTMDPAVKAFTIGFWFKTDGVCISNGSSILANKNYYSGRNDGFAIALFPATEGCEIRFNTGGGGGRGDLKDNFFVAANQWAYVAMSVDKENMQLYGYVMDANKGQQHQVRSIDAGVAAAIGGEKHYAMALGDDITGLYSKANKFIGMNSYTDLAVWNRMLSLEEVKNIYTSRYPISSVLP